MTPPLAPAAFNFAGDVAYRRARETPEAVATLAIRADGSVEDWTCARIADRTRRFASALAAAGLVKGDRVLLFMDRTPDWQVAMTACLHLGAIPVPCVTQVTADEVAHRVERSGAAGAICDRRFADRFGGLASALRVRVARDGAEGWIDFEAAASGPDRDIPVARMDADDPALMYFTSGSSGPPKAVVHAARGVFVRSMQPWRQLGMGPGDVIWTTSDTGWTRAGSCLLFGAWMNGAVALLHENPPEPAARLDILEAYGVTIFGAVTTELRLILAAGHKRPLPKLRWTLSAGEAMTAEMAERWGGFSGRPLLVGYGQSETPTATLTDPATPAINGMIGKPMAGNTVCIVDSDGAECAPGVPGDLAFGIEDPGLMLGYWKNGKADLPLRADRWHVSGDVGYRDATGDLYFVGRDDDIISSSGYRIGPTEVENALTLHPAVAECAVVASPDELRGEVVKAVVVLRPGARGDAALASELQDHVKQKIAPYKYPRKVEFVESLPRTVSGKISRRLLRDAEFKTQSPVLPPGGLQ
ncbi:MAG: AMP-binding protein [Betaproteobacteria bacterium]